MFDGKFRQGLFAVAAIATTCFFGIQSADAAIRDFHLELVPQSAQELRASYSRMLTFVRTSGGNDARYSRTYYYTVYEPGIGWVEIPNFSINLPMTPATSQDVIRVTLTAQGIFGPLYVYINPVNLYIMGFARPLDNMVYYFNDNNNQQLLMANGLQTTAQGNLGTGNYARLDPNAGIRTTFNFTQFGILNTLATLANTRNPQGLITPLVVLTQFIAEAARFRPIEAIMRTGMINWYMVNNNLPSNVVALESGNAWGTVTARVGTSANGTISPYQLGDTTLYNIAQVNASGLGVLLGSQLPP
jgi:hypothetical protein